ncbi:hypothetical protein QA635_08785 [Bradyrhizobium brasilense]|uniref:hypothetical protein n=1 Tax=Bradyrhizobium brasilense TaxID=1419277 RepID=UPI0024B10495|nr:hypothetical protein [Bradyrhizobium australafricanum]WFU34487.1 hypothetical protein QA635_08785 [Bradyrhizobium australafricanum]
MSKLDAGMLVPQTTEFPIARHPPRLPIKHIPPDLEQYMTTALDIEMIKFRAKSARRHFAFAPISLPPMLNRQRFARSHVPEISSISAPHKGPPFKAL